MLNSSLGSLIQIIKKVEKYNKNGLPAKISLNGEILYLLSYAEDKDGNIISINFITIDGKKIYTIDEEIIFDIIFSYRLNEYIIELNID